MIDISKYPNLSSSPEEDYSVFRHFPNDTVIVWDLPSGFILDRYKKGEGCVAVYRFPTIEEALEAANNLDGTAEGWNAISQFLEERI